MRRDHRGRVLELALVVAARRSLAFPDGQHGRRSAGAGRAEVWAIGTKDGPSADGGPFLRTSVYGVYRQGDEARLILGTNIVGDDSEGKMLRPVGLFTKDHTDADDPSAYKATGLTLVDPSARKAYLVARDDDGKCLCSDTPDLAAFATTVVGAQFAAPPADLSQIDVVLPKFGVLRGVPVTDGAPPRELLEEKKPTSTTEPGVLIEDLDSDGPAPFRSTDTRTAKGRTPTTRSSPSAALPS